MISDNTIDKLIQPVLDRQESINTFVILRIANRLRDVKKLRPSDLRTLKYMRIMGADVREINNELAKQSKLQIREIKTIIKTAGLESYKDTKPFYDYRHKSYIPFDENKDLQKIVRSIGNITANEYVNLSNSKAIGFLICDKSNPNILKFKSIEDTYKQTIDTAIQAVSGKLLNPDEAIRRAIKQLLSSGIRRVYWSSGYTQRLDTAVRRNVLGGIYAIDQQIQDEIGKQFESDGKELSAHLNSAPDHEPFQGHIFTNEEWEKLQSNKNFKDIDGIQFTAVSRTIGSWNCKHIADSIIIGAKKPRYTKAQLQKFIKDNHKGYTLSNGKHLTMYECEQLQRQLETRIRYAKEEQMTMNALGDDIAKNQARAKVIKLSAEYRQFSNACGLPIKMKRASIPNYKA